MKADDFISPVRAPNVTRTGSDSRSDGMVAVAPRFGRSLARALRRIAAAIEVATSTSYELTPPALVADAAIVAPIDLANLDEDGAELVGKHMRRLARRGVRDPFEGALMGPPNLSPRSSRERA